MKAGNFNNKYNLEFNYIDSDVTSFDSKQFEKRLLFRSHQNNALDVDQNYTPLNKSSKIITLNCVCNKSNNDNLIEKIVEEQDLKDVLLWIDPCNIPVTCFTSLILSWNKIKNTERNIAIAIPVNEGESRIRYNKYALWKPSILGPIKKENRNENSIWYPSLERDRNSLLAASEYLDPYDVHPIIDFAKAIVQAGEHDLTNHSLMLENTRTRTRNFIHFDYKNPKRTFIEFLGVLQNIPRNGSFKINPTITPGGNNTIYLLTAIAGALSESDFLTPFDEVPVTSNRDIHGILLLRKCA